MLVRVELQPAVAARLYSYHQLVLARALAHRDDMATGQQARGHQHSRLC